jgi:GAF domain-containing protein
MYTIENVADDPRVPAEMRQSLARSGMLGLANIPLQVADRVVGFVIVQRATPGPFSGMAVRLYETLANQAAVALERAQLLEEAQRRAERERFIGEIAARMRETLDIDTVLNTTANEIYEALGLKRVVIRLATDEAGGKATD